MKGSLFVVAFFLCLSAGLPVQLSASSQGVSTEIQNAAVSAFQDFKRVNTNLLLQDQRIGTPEDLKRATMGTPIPECFIVLESLATYPPSKNPKTILSCGEIWVYPVILDGRALTGLEIAKLGDTWAWDDTISDTEMQKALAIVKAISPAQSNSIVYLTTLNLTFIAEVQDQDIILSLVSGDLPKGFNAGDRISAKSLFPQLRTAAVARITTDAVWKQRVLPPAVK